MPCYCEVSSVSAEKQSGRVAEALEVLRPLPALYPGQQDYQNAYNMALWHSGARNLTQLPQSKIKSCCFFSILSKKGSKVATTF